MGNEPTPKLTIVIPTHDRKDKLVRLLDSIAKSDLDESDREIVVVADRCSDGTQALLAECYPEVRIVDLVGGEPAYVAGGREIGFRAARGELIFFVDDDNVVDPACLSGLVSVLASHPSVGSLGPLMYRYDQASRLWCAGAVLTRFGAVSHPGLNGPLLVDPLDPDVLQRCDYVPNAFMTTRRVLEQVPFDVAAFRHGWCEVDWGLRLARAGYEVRVATGAKVWHDVGYSGLMTRLDVPAHLIENRARARVFARRRFRDEFGSPLKFWLAVFPLSTALFFVRIARAGRFRALAGAYLRGTWQGATRPLPPPP